MKLNKNLILSSLFVSASMLLSGCLLAAAGGAEAGYVAAQDNRSAKETIHDQYLTSAVKTALIATKGIPAMDINVDTFKAQVSLRGALKTHAQVEKAIDVARSVKGVEHVESKLVVVP